MAADSMVRDGARTGGVLCAALFNDGQKMGITCAALRGAESVSLGVLGRAHPDWKVPRSPSEAGSALPAFSVPFDDTDPQILRYGMWAFDKAVLTKADELTAADLSAIQTGAGSPRLIFVDEIGPLELDKSTGMIASLRMLDHLSAYRFGAGWQVVVARPDIAARLQARWPDAVMLEMEAGHADQTARQIILRCRS